MVAPKTIQICTAGECGGGCYRCRCEKLQQRVESLEAFRRLVGYMRFCQRQYFDTRSQAALAEARRYEKRVDDALRDLECPSLF
jgi:hypothetical protein